MKPKNHHECYPGGSIRGCRGIFKFSGFQCSVFCHQLSVGKHEKSTVKKGGLKLPSSALPYRISQSHKWPTASSNEIRPRMLSAGTNICLVYSSAPQNALFLDIRSFHSMFKCGPASRRLVRLFSSTASVDVLSGYSMLEHLANMFSSTAVVDVLLSYG